MSKGKIHRDPRTSPEAENDYVDSLPPGESRTVVPPAPDPAEEDPNRLTRLTEEQLAEVQRLKERQRRHNHEGNNPYKETSPATEGSEQIAALLSVAAGLAQRDGWTTDEFEGSAAAALKNLDASNLATGAAPAGGERS